MKFAGRQISKSPSSFMLGLVTKCNISLKWRTMQWTVRVPFAAETWCFFIHCHSQNYFGAHLVSTMSYFAGCKGSQIVKLSSVEVKNAQNLSPTLILFYVMPSITFHLYTLYWIIKALWFWLLQCSFLLPLLPLPVAWLCACLWVPLTLMF
jgi:hypothetical protein